MENQAEKIIKTTQKIMAELPEDVILVAAAKTRTLEEVRL